MRIIKLLFVFILLFSCENAIIKNKSIFSKNEILEDNTVKSFNIIDSNYQGIGSTKKIYQSKDSIYFFTLGTTQQKLEIVNLTSQQVKMPIEFYANDILTREKLHFEDFYVHDLDSIFLLSTNNYKLVLINHHGSVKQIWDLNQETLINQNDNFLHITATGANTLYYDAKNKSVLLRTFPPVNFNLDNSFYNKYFGIKYDLTEKKLKESFGKWPSDYSKNEFLRPNNHLLSYIPVFNENCYYVSFRYDHNIYKYNLENNELLETIDGKSNFLDNFEKLPKNENTQATIDYIRVNGFYNKLTHFPDSNRFYRVVVHNQPSRNATTQKLNNPTFGRDFSVIVFDEKLKKIGEYVFRNNTELTFFAVTSYAHGLLLNTKNSSDENINVFTFIDF